VSDFNRLASQVYVGIRDGVLDPEAAFDLACFLMDGGQVLHGPEHPRLLILPVIRR
jgi:hypothetical protein